MNSYLVQRLSAAKRSGQNLPLGLGLMIQVSLSLWMRALWIAERHIVDEHGPYVAGRLLERPSSVEENGELYRQLKTDAHLTLYYQVLRPSCIIPK
jgi:hypothetical protein